MLKKKNIETAADVKNQKTPGAKTKLKERSKK